jgi:uncharacterized protein GlcG (DUF336 family)
MKKTLTFGALCAMALASGIAVAQTPAPAAPPGPPPPAARGPALAVSTAMANDAIAACAANGYTVAVSIVDSAGVLKVLLAADGAHVRAVESSTKKATTALALKMPTSEVAEKAKTDQALAAKLTADTTLFARAGGLLIKVGDETIGAIGVGGAPGGEKDEACAKDALDKVKGELK